MASIRISAAGRQLALHNGKGRPIYAQSIPRIASFAKRSYSGLHPLRQNSFSLRKIAPAYGVPLISARHASTSATPSQSPSIPVTPQPTPAEPVNELATSFDSFDAPLPDLTPHIGYLKELGLDFGWGPTAFVQWMIEHIQVGTGTSMWLAVLGSVILTRVALLPVFFQASDTQARLATMGPVIKPFQERMKTAQMAGDQTAMMEARKDMADVMKKANIRYRDIFFPILFQAPLGYGLFRLTRGMAGLPLPELQQTHIAWLTDLSVHDPFFLLPAVTSFTIYLTLKAGGEAGEASGANVKMQKYLRIGVPTLSFIFTGFLPSITQIGFFAGAGWGAFQAFLLKNPVVRRVLNLHPLPGKGAPKPNVHPSAAYSGTMTRETTARVVTPPKATGFSAMREKFDELRKTANDIAAKREKSHSRLTKTELKSATTYESRKKKAEEQEMMETKERERLRRLRRKGTKN